MAQTVKNLPAMQNLPAMRETGIRSLDQEDPLEKAMATVHRVGKSWTRLSD